MCPIGCVLAVSGDMQRLALGQFCVFLSLLCMALTCFFPPIFFLSSLLLLF